MCLCFTDMARDVYEIDGAKFNDFAGFAEEFTREFCSRFEATWRGNLDAFNDYLVWPDEPYRLVWKHSSRSRERLDHAEMAKWLEERVQHCHSTAVPEMQRRLDAARRGIGPTLFNIILEIIQDNQPYVELVLE